MYCYNGSVLICQGISVYSTFFKLQVYPENSFQKIRLFFFLIHRKFQLLHTFFRQPCLIRPAITAGSLPELLRIGKLKPQILPFSRLQPALSFIRPDDPNPQFLFPTLFFHCFSQKIIQILHLDSNPHMFKIGDRSISRQDQNIMIIIISMHHPVFRNVFFINLHTA